MRIKNKRGSRGCDTYLRAHQRAYAWAEKAMLYRSAGKFSQAQAAVTTVERWLRKIAVLEAERASL